MDASVIVATRNRAQFLSALLDALAEQTLPADTSWELIVVDNGSTDTTAQVLMQEQGRGRLPLLPLQEAIPGKSRALNLAMARARGRLWIFTDDDVLPEPGWLGAYLDAARRHPTITGFAGRVLPKWLGELPGWLHTEGDFAMPRGITNTRDFGPDEHLLPGDVIPGGVNTALRADAARRNGEFRVDMGPGTSIPYAEDTDFMGRYAKSGGGFWYVPRAVLHHCNVPERMTKAYVMRWAYQAARCQVLGAAARKDAVTSTAGVPNYLWRQVAERGVAWLFELRPMHRIMRGLRFNTTRGQIRGYRELQDPRQRDGSDKKLRG